MIFTGTGIDSGKDFDDYSFIGSKRVSFKIKGIPMGKVKVENLLKDYTYTGEEIQPMEIFGNNNSYVKLCCDIKNAARETREYTLVMGEAGDDDCDCTA